MLEWGGGLKKIRQPGRQSKHAEEEMTRDGFPLQLQLLALLALDERNVRNVLFGGKTLFGIVCEEQKSK